MHPHQFLLSLALFVASISAEELEGPTVPAPCRTICEPIVLISNACDVELDEKRRRKRDDGPLDELEDRLEAGCFCQNKSFDVAGISALCADCIAQNPTDREAIKDVSKIMSECAFSSTKYTPQATSLVKDITIVAIVPTVMNPGGGPAGGAAASLPQQTSAPQGEKGRIGGDEPQPATSAAPERISRSMVGLASLGSLLVGAWMAVM